MTSDSLEQQLGSPSASFTDKGQTILQYTSIAPSLADYYTFQNNKLTYISKSYYANPKDVSPYISRYGQPPYSVYKFPKNSEDSLLTVVHAWPQAGVAVTTQGGLSQQDARVIREDQYAPITLNEYQASWGRDYANNELATFSAQSLISPPNTLSNQSEILRGPFEITLGIVILLIFVLVALRRRRRILAQRPLHKEE